MTALQASRLMLRERYEQIICSIVIKWVQSTVTALIKFTDDWLKSLEDGSDICAFF